MAITPFQNNLFVQERAQRYTAAMQQYPSARYLEILPLLCLFAHESTEKKHLVDIASGGGYLGHFFEAVAEKVTYVDQSLDMLRQVESENVVVSDMRRVSEVLGEQFADMTACLAAFHHLHVPDIEHLNGTYDIEGTRTWTPEHHLNIHESQALHDAVLADWYRLLKPNGTMVLIDVPGYPDQEWEPFWSGETPHTVNTKGYQEQFIERLEAWSLPTDPERLQTFIRHGWGDMWETDPHIAQLREMLNSSAELTLKDLVDSYQMPSSIFYESAPMVPTDFFDDVIDKQCIQRHFGYFPRERKIYQALVKLGMEDIFVGTFPTPWMFDSRESAVWFVHELFSLGRPWSRKAIPPQEYEELADIIDTYLGLHEDGYGRTLLYWQLTYFIARKPAEEVRT